MVWQTSGGPCAHGRFRATSPTFKTLFPLTDVSVVQLGIGFVFVAPPAGGEHGNVDAVHLTFQGGSLDTDFDVPHPPVAVNDSYATEQDHPLVVPGPSGVLLNDVVTDSHLLSAALTPSQPTHGTVTLETDGGFTYTPAAGFSGTDTFSYVATDTVWNLPSMPATVTITVTPVVVPPPPPPPPPSTAGKFVPLDPHRIVDTRTGLGGSGMLAADSTTTFTAGGAGGVPASGVSAVALNVTATDPQAPGFVQLFPAGGGTPGATSSVNVDHAGSDDRQPRHRRRGRRRTVLGPRPVFDPARRGRLGLFHAGAPKRSRPFCDRRSDPGSRHPHRPRVWWRRGAPAGRRPPRPQRDRGRAR